MAETKRKGDLGEVMVMADALRRGYKVALPYGEDWRYDLIVFRKGKLERVQCKYTTSDGNIIVVACQSCNAHATQPYTPEQVDWIAVYDVTTNACYYVPSDLLTGGRRTMTLRITSTKNNQAVRVLWAKDFLVW